MQTNSKELDSLNPETAVELYLDHRRPELSEKSLLNHKYRLNSFLKFCEEQEITDLNELSGRDLHHYRTWRRNQDINLMTLRSNLATLRVFLEFAADIDAVEPGLRERVKLPQVDSEEEAKDVKLDGDRARAILDYLEKFRYASRDHVIMAILWHTGIRLGSLRAFDLDDFDADSQCLDLHHRPETGTPLKNGKGAERSIAISKYYVGVLQDYISYERHRIQDEHGRRPLLASNQGRLTETPIRNTIYRLTRPCVIDLDCPHEREPETCEAMGGAHGAVKCPSSKSPHSIRRGSITVRLRDGTPEAIVSDRCDVSQDVLDQHYDRRTEREKMDTRREYLKDL